LNALAQKLNVLRGSLTRWLLPFDHNTRIDEVQSSTLQSVLNNVPEFLQDKIPRNIISDFVFRLNNIRKLVRVKIADDNDLEQARDALKAIVSFFKKLQVSLTQRKEGCLFSMFDLLECRLNLHSDIGNNKSKK